jgi:hypothetical protein
MAARQKRIAGRSGNLWATRLPARRRNVDPMAAFDALPPDLRDWVAHAALPWSPSSCLKLWCRALAEEGCPDRARARLDRAEAALLARDGWMQMPEQRP